LRWSEGIAGDFGVFGGPVVGREGDAPESGGGFEECYADFGFAFGGWGDVNDADELLFEGVGVAAEDSLADFDAHGQEDQGAVGVDGSGERVFRDMLTIGAAPDDEDGETQKDALAAAAIVNGSVVGRRNGHGEVGPGNSVGEEEDGVKRPKVLNFQREKMVPEEGVEPTRGVIPGRF
jgi:hypothetical protein